MIFLNKFTTKSIYIKSN